MRPVGELPVPVAEHQKLVQQLVADFVDTWVEDLEVLRCWTWGHLGLQMSGAAASEALGEVPSA